MRRAEAKRRRRFKEGEEAYMRWRALSPEEQEAHKLQERLAEYRKEKPQFKLLEKRLKSYCQRQGITGGMLKANILKLAYHPPESEFIRIFKSDSPMGGMDIDSKRFRAVLRLEELEDKRAGLPILWSLELNKGYAKGFISALGELKEKRAFPVLERMLKEPDRKVGEQERREALKALIKIDPKAALKPALRSFRKDADEGVKEIAAKFLGEMKEKKAVPLLLNAIYNFAERDNIKYDAAVGETVVALGKIAPTLVKGKVKKQVLAAEEILSGTNPAIKALIVYSLAVNPGLRRPAPVDAKDARGRDYLFSLRNDLMDSLGGERSLKEVFSLLGLFRKKR